MLDFRVNTFLAVCRTMNFTRAARELNITQPAVSQHIHFLEKYYSARLFHYHNRRLCLTDQGLRLREYLMTMKNDELLIARELQTEEKAAEELEIGVTMTVGEYAVVRPLAAYCKRHPETNVHLHFGNTSQLLEKMEAGRISLALVEGYFPREDYEALPFRRESFVAVCASGHQFVCGRPDRLEDLTCERLLVREEGSGTRSILEKNLDPKGLGVEDFRHRIEAENMHTIVELLKADCGISFLYRPAVEAELEAGSLREIPLSDFSMEHDFDFIWEKGSIFSGRYREIGQELIGCQDGAGGGL